MADIDLIVKQLRENGHEVEDVHMVPPNAGDYNLIVDGEGINLDEARIILERDEART